MNPIRRPDAHPLPAAESVELAWATVDELRSRLAVTRSDLAAARRALADSVDRELRAVTALRVYEAEIDRILRAAGAGR